MSQKKNLETVLKSRTGVDKLELLTSVQKCVLKLHCDCALLSVIPCTWGLYRREVVVVLGLSSWISWLTADKTSEIMWTLLTYDLEKPLTIFMSTSPPIFCQSFINLNFAYQRPVSGLFSSYRFHLQTFATLWPKTAHCWWPWGCTTWIWRQHENMITLTRL